MADILVAMAQHARNFEEQETFPRSTMAAHGESNPSLASNAEAQTRSQQSDKEEQSDDEEESESDDGSEKESKGKATEKNKPKRALVKLASLEVFSEPHSNSKEWVASFTRRQLKDIVKRIRHNLEALSAADAVKTTMTTPRKGNEGSFRVLNKTIQINNLRG
jgi:hypothetical protein